MKMKKILGCFLALCLVVTAVSGVFTTAKADDFIYVETMADLKNAISRASSGTRIVVCGSTFTVDESITIPEEIEIAFSGDVSQVTIAAGKTVTVNGWLFIGSSPISVDGTLISNGVTTLCAGLTINKNGIVQVNNELDVMGGELINNGTLTVADDGFLDYIPPEVDTGERIAIDETNFPDAGFRSMISGYYDSNGDGYMTTDSFAQITELWAMGPSIGDLEGIQYFTNLEVLHVGHNGDGESPLRLLDVSGMTKLKSIKADGVTGSNLVYLNVTGCSALEEIDVVGGFLTPAGLVGVDDTKVDVSTIAFYGQQAPTVAGDMDGDGELTAMDLTLLARKVAKVD